jgi:hypothetical protein
VSAQRLREQKVVEETIFLQTHGNEVEGGSYKEIGIVPVHF